MRQQIDCAVLVLSAHQSWLPKVLTAAEPGLNRVKLYSLEWEAGGAQESQGSNENISLVSLPVEALAQAGLGLRRYDLVLLPVSMETLAWTRQALAAIPRGPFIPLLAIIKDLRSAAIQDLLEMGMADFVRLPLCPEEFRARLLHAITSTPRLGSLREPTLNYQQQIAISRGVLPKMSEASLQEWIDLTRTKSLKISMPKGDHLRNVLSGRMPEKPESESEKIERLKIEYEKAREYEAQLAQFISAEDGGENPQDRQDPQDTDDHEEDESDETVRGNNGHHLKVMKARLVEDFERAYIIEALECNNGNIATAARYSGKHRRAFWALMRKYGIEAEDFRY